MAISGLQTVGIRPVSTRTRNSGPSISVYKTINTHASHFSIQRFVNFDTSRRYSWPRCKEAANTREKLIKLMDGGRQRLINWKKKMAGRTSRISGKRKINDAL